MGGYTIQLDSSLIRPRIRTRTRSFQGNEQFIFTLHRRITDLNISEEHHPGRSPVFHCIGKHISIHERGVGLTDE